MIILLWPEVTKLDGRPLRRYAWAAVRRLFWPAVFISWTLGAESWLNTWPSSFATVYLCVWCAVIAVFFRTCK
jgi:hypothetical protein